MATPVVHDGVPVAVRERKNSLKHPEEEDEEEEVTKRRKSVTGIIALIVCVDIILISHCCNKRKDTESQNLNEKNLIN